MALKKNAFESIVGKGENAGNKHFSFAHNVLYLIKDINHHFRNSKLSPAYTCT